MKRTLLVCLAAALMLAGTAAAATITLDQPSPVAAGSQVTFTVETSGDADYTVVNSCSNFQTGQYSSETLPVVDGAAGPFTVPDWAIECHARLLRNEKTVQNSNGVAYCIDPSPPGVVCSTDFS